MLCGGPDIGGVFFELDVDERLDAGAADRARVVLHPHDLTAGLAEAQMATGQHHCVLDRCEADDTLTLRLVRCAACRAVVLPVHVGQLEDRLVVQQFLLQELEPKRVISFDREGSQTELDGLLGPSFVVCWEQGLNGDDHRVEIVAVMRQIAHWVLAQVQTTDTLG